MSRVLVLLTLSSQGEGSDREGLRGIVRQSDRIVILLISFYSAVVLVHSALLWLVIGLTLRVTNRPFPRSLVPLFQNESKCETFHMKMSSACSFIFMQIKVIFIRVVSHLDLLWNSGTSELGSGLLCSYLFLGRCKLWTHCKILTVVIFDQALRENETDEYNAHILNNIYTE